MFFGKTPRTPYGSGRDALSVSQEIGDFVATTSRAYGLLQRHFGSAVRLVELKAIVRAAIAVVKYTNGIELPKFSRNTWRSWKLLVKYVDTHYAALAPVFPTLTLCDKHRNPIPILDVVGKDAQDGMV
jgi:hypothetical protein